MLTPDELAADMRANEVQRDISRLAKHSHIHQWSDCEWKYTFSSHRGVATGKRTAKQICIIGDCQEKRSV